MIPEQQMKDTLQAYVNAFNCSDTTAITALYAEDATVEDPVGKPPIAGRAAIGKFYEMAVRSGAKLALAAPIRASQGREAAMAFDVQIDLPQGSARIRVIDVMSFNDDGQIATMRAFWGMSDMEMNA